MSDTPSIASMRDEQRPWLSPAQALAARPLHDQTAEPAAQPDRRTQRYGYTIGELALLVGAGMTAESLTAPKIHPMPNTADWFLGLLNLRGHLIPVFDLQKLLQPQPNGEDRRRDTIVLVLDRGERAVGLCIDALPVAVMLDRPLAQAPSSGNLLDDHVKAAYAGIDRLWLDVDLDAFLRAMRDRVAG